MHRIWNPPPPARALGVLIVPLAALVLRPGAAGAADVIIIRDTWGIAHVYSGTDAGAMFGAGYASAQDRLYQMHRNRRAVQGRLAELVGLRRGGSFGSTVEQDRNFRHRQLDRYARRVVAKLDGSTRAMLLAYCAGVNHYIDTHRDDLLYLFEGQVPEPWEPADCLGAWNRVADYFSSSGLNKVQLQHEFERLVEQYGLEKAIELFSPPPILDEDAAIVKREDVPPETIELWEQYARDHGFGKLPSRFFMGAGAGDFEPPKFSHAWVVGGTRSGTGAAVLHSDPQTAVAGPSIWYEIHVRGATFDARGIGVAGCPGFLIGWNGGVAWGLTALGPDVSDLFELKMAGPNEYEYDGQRYAMEVWQEVIRVKGGADVPITLRDTHLGPVVTAVCGDVQPGEEFIWKAIPNADTDRHTVQAALAMLRARDLDGFRQAIGLWRHPGANCVFGDSAGNCGYWALAAIPVRSIESPVGGRIAQDGSSSRFDWQDTLPGPIRPHVINPSQGSIWSGNHLPIGAWYPIPLYLGTGGHGDTVRSWRLAERMRGQAALPPEEVLDIHFDPVNPARREIVRAGYHLRDVLQEPLLPSARSALSILESWYAHGARSDAAEPYYAAAYHLNISFRERDAGELVGLYGGGENGLCYFLKTLQKRLDDDPQAQLSPAEKAYIEASLATGWETAVRNYGSDPNQWQARFAAGPGTYRIQYFNTLEGFGSMDAGQDTSWSGLTTVDGGTILSQRGQSYSQWVDLGRIDESLALQPIGVSEDPGSDFFSDQAPLWIEMRLRAAPLDRRIVEEMETSRQRLAYVESGDLNGDCVVGQADLAILLADYGCQSGDGTCSGDVDGDGRTTQADLAILLANYGQTCP